MEVTQVLRMNGGMGDTSYANNSLVQRKVLALTEPIREEAITNMYCKMLPESLVIADLGCSSGPNTFFVVSEAIKTVEKLCRELNHQSPEYQVFLNDLPGSDFNNIFRSLGSFKDKLSHEMVPKGVENNKGNIYMPSTSPSNVLKPYYQQFQRDFSLFPECRAKEVVEGGTMVLTFLGRKSDEPSSKECCFIWELMAKALNDLASMGIIKEEEVDLFNIPQDTPSASEVEEGIVKEGSVSINQMEVSAVDWNAYSDWNTRDNEFSETEVMSDGAYNVTQCMRAVAEPLLISHFGEDIIEQVFTRDQEILTHHMSKAKTQFINVTFSMTKRSV